MTAKQALLDYVQTMSEDEAEELLERLKWESSEFDDEPLTAEEEAMLAEAKKSFEAGDFMEAREFFKKLER